MQKPVGRKFETRETFDETEQENHLVCRSCKCMDELRNCLVLRRSWEAANCAVVQKFINILGYYGVRLTQHTFLIIYFYKKRPQNHINSEMSRLLNVQNIPQTTQTEQTVWIS
jgi:hypothetical protein